MATELLKSIDYIAEQDSEPNKVPEASLREAINAQDIGSKLMTTVISKAFAAVALYCVPFLPRFLVATTLTAVRMLCV